MKKTIEGIIYDTEKASLVATLATDSYVDRLYYKPRSQAYFVHGTGDENSRYAKRDCFGRWNPHERIYPISGWAAKHIANDPRAVMTEYGLVHNNYLLWDAK